MPIPLDGGCLSGAAAQAAGLVDTLVAPGDEIAATEAWLLERPKAVQPWDSGDHAAPAVAVAVAVVADIAPIRERVLAATLGHYPALLAMLDWVEFGMPQLFDGAIRTEMAIFAHLIQRPEARDMIQTQFIARTEHDRLRRKDALPGYVTHAVAKACDALAGIDDTAALAAAGLGGGGAPHRTRTMPGCWIDTAKGAAAPAAITRIDAAIAPPGIGRTDGERRIIDYAVVAAIGYPAYLGGPLASARA